MPEIGSVLIESQMMNDRTVRTATCQKVEVRVQKTISNHPLPAMALRMLLGKLLRFFVSVDGRVPYLSTLHIGIPKVTEILLEGNVRQHFHVIRSLLGPLRSILRHLSGPGDILKTLLLKDLDEAGVMDPNLMRRLVSNAAFGDTDEILAPPEDLRQIWKPVARERTAPDNGGKFGKSTGDL
ncbi:uncharacterized protein KY384_008650 [Bacidia gigantensis]|uniref:uncharacterized protein n=1 Tax=Bacidia gigantensis TaxID=2732470 RepID=UPI001D037B80|nr:uncharacterized protein KY384_008650 [Bacidia gigantensis]KAG8527220.1 hypothetical protein KY384_008650 [Bacidia gigantensis]